jgi:hypothetical protein
MNSNFLTLGDQRLLEFHDQLSSAAEQLVRIDPNDMTDDEGSINRFKAFRLKWLHVVEEVEIGILTIIVGRLNALEPEFRAGIDALNTALQEANDIVAILGLIEKSLLIVGQIVALAI